MAWSSRPGAGSVIENHKITQKAERAVRKLVLEAGEGVSVLYHASTVSINIACGKLEEREHT